MALVDQLRHAAGRCPPPQRIRQPKSAPFKPCMAHLLAGVRALPDDGRPKGDDHAAKDQTDDGPGPPIIVVGRLLAFVRFAHDRPQAVIRPDIRRLGAK